MKTFWLTSKKPSERTSRPQNINVNTDWITSNRQNGHFHSNNHQTDTHHTDIHQTDNHETDIQQTDNYQDYIQQADIHQSDCHTNLQRIKKKILENGRKKAPQRAKNQNFEKQKLRYFLMSQRVLCQKIRFLGQKLSPVARVQTDRHQTNH